MSISRWSSNHQNGDVLSLLLVFVAYIVDRLRRIAACSSWKLEIGFIALSMSEMSAPRVPEVRRYIRLLLQFNNEVDTRGPIVD